jgi:hypothetical protein
MWVRPMEAQFQSRIHLLQRIILARRARLLRCMSRGGGGREWKGGVGVYDLMNL